MKCAFSRLDCFCRSLMVREGTLLLLYMECAVSGLDCFCRSLMVREGELLETDTLSELGIFGSFLRRGDKVLLNNEAGHLIRTKVTTCALYSLHSTLSWLVTDPMLFLLLLYLNIKKYRCHMFLCCPVGRETVAAMSNGVPKRCKDALESIAASE